MKNISMEKFNSLLRKAMNDGSALRVGQSFFSELHHEYPEIANEIIGTDADPFYEDENIYNLMKLIVTRKA